MMADPSTPAFTIAKKVDDKVVKELIQKLLDAYGVYDPITRNRLAFEQIKSLRKAAPGLTLDLNLAAVDHYLYARARVSSGQISIVQMRLMTSSYDAYKAVFGEESVQTDGLPASPPDLDVTLWGLSGAEAGEVDRKTYNKGATPQLADWSVLSNIGSTGKKISEFLTKATGGKSGY